MPAMGRPDREEHDGGGRWQAEGAFGSLHERVNIGRCGPCLRLSSHAWDMRQCQRHAGADERPFPGRCLSVHNVYRPARRAEESQKWLWVLYGGDSVMDVIANAATNAIDAIQHGRLGLHSDLRPAGGRHLFLDPSALSADLPFSGIHPGGDPHAREGQPGHHPIQALTTSLASRVGTGNIAGVAVAVTPVAPGPLLDVDRGPAGHGHGLRGKCAGAALQGQ